MADVAVQALVQEVAQIQSKRWDNMVSEEHNKAGIRRRGMQILGVDIRAGTVQSLERSRDMALSLE